MWHEADALKIMQGPARLAIKDMAAAAHDGSIEDYRMPSVFEDAVDEHAIDEVLVVQLQAFAFDGSAVNDLHGILLICLGQTSRADRNL